MGCLEMYCLLAKNHFGKSTPLKFLAPFAADATPPLLSLEFEARYFAFRQIRPCPSLIPLKIMRAINVDRSSLIGSARPMSRPQLEIWNICFSLFFHSHRSIN